MKAFLVNYNFTPTWLLDSDLDYVIHDRSDSKDYLKDFDQSKIVYEANVGQVDFPKLNYLYENYDQLPDVFLWGKANLFKYITEEEYGKVKDNQLFTPLLTQNHKTYSDNLGPVCYYSGGMYNERLDVANAAIRQFSTRYFNRYQDFAKHFHISSPYYLPFAPGGNHILTKEVVHRYSKDFYGEMASILPYCREPAEAQMCERSYYQMWQ